MPGKALIEVLRKFATMSVLLVGLLAIAPAALAVPSFARQTGMACEACHTVYPELTHFGRVFKANGYILSNLKQVRDVSGKKGGVARAVANAAPVDHGSDLRFAAEKGVARSVH